MNRPVSIKFRPYVTIITYMTPVGPHPGAAIGYGDSSIDYWILQDRNAKKCLTSRIYMYLINVTVMARSKAQRSEDSKTRSLREHHALHGHPENIRDEAFQKYEFLDPRDKVQVRYEMLRRRRVEGKPVAEVARSFGMSRQAFYVTDATFSEHGIPGLLPRRRGPRGAHKCTDEVLDFVERWVAEGEETLVEAIRRRFSVKINPRSIERALARRKKKRARKQETQE